MSTLLATTQPQDLMADIQRRLDQRRDRFGVGLQAGACKEDGDWHIVVVTPVAPGVRAYDYTQVLSEVEQELCEAGMDRVVLVPALDD